MIVCNIQQVSYPYGPVQVKLMEWSCIFKDIISVKFFYAI